MTLSIKQISAILLILFSFSLIDMGLSLDKAEARSRFGGRSFSRSRTYRPPPTRQSTAPSSMPRRSGTGSFTRGLAGGLMGGAIGSLLFGGMAHGYGGGIGGSGIGLFQILIFAGIGYFLYKQFFKRPSSASQYQQTGYTSPGYFDSGMSTTNDQSPPPPPPGEEISLSEELATLQRSDPEFDPDHFKEIAQDVFFQVQAGWMRRDIDSYRHLLGEQLAREYEGHFAEISRKGHINKLENIAVRNVEIVDAGLFGNFEAVTVLFTANLLDYTVDENSGELIEGSMTSPVKFAEKWTWGRPVGDKEWKLERIEIVND